MKHLKTQKQLNEASENLNISDTISRLSDRVDEIANKTDADIDRTLFRIVGNHIEVYEIDLSEEKVKSFLGSFNMNEELFGELHEQEEYGLFGKEHQHQQCFLYSVSDHTSSNNSLKIEPVYDGISTAVTQYKITDDLGSIWMQGTRDECERYLYGR